MTRTFGVLALALLGASGVAAQGERGLTIPVALSGVVHRVVTSGCGQSWDGAESRAQVTLDVDVHHLARLRVTARIVDAHGGVSLLGGGERYHSEHETARSLAWTGRARLDRGALVVSLRSLVETVPVDGSPTLTVTNHRTEEAVLRCAREERDVFAATRPTGIVDEPALGRRSLVSCTFEPREHEGPLPRPVDEVLTPPFFLDTGAGVTTDALYDGYVSADPEWFVAREP